MVLGGGCRPEAPASDVDDRSSVCLPNLVVCEVLQGRIVASSIVGVERYPRCPPSPLLGAQRIPEWKPLCETSNLAPSAHVSSRLLEDDHEGDRTSSLMRWAESRGGECCRFAKCLSGGHRTVHAHSGDSDLGYASRPGLVEHDHSTAGSLSVTMMRVRVGGHPEPKSVLHALRWWPPG